MTGAAAPSPSPTPYASSSPSVRSSSLTTTWLVRATQLPANMRIGWVEVDLYGRFECSPSSASPSSAGLRLKLPNLAMADETHTAFDVQVQREAIASLEFQANASRCQGCRNCGYLHKATSRHYGVGTHMMITIRSANTLADTVGVVPRLLVCRITITAPKHPTSSRLSCTLACSCSTLRTSTSMPRTRPEARIST